VAVQLRNSFGF